MADLLHTRRLAPALLTTLLLLAAAAPMTASGQGGTPDKGKESCTWEMTGVTDPSGTGTGSQVITLSCPHHIELGEPQYGYKDCRNALGLPCAAPAGDIVVTDLGRQDEPKVADPATGVVNCGWTRSWLVSSPSVNTYVFWFRVHTLKDADCDKKPDDWNTEVSEDVRFSDKPEPTVWRQTNTLPPSVVNHGDGALDGNPCAYHNTFYGGRIREKPQAAGGQKDPRAPGYAPIADGEVNECDWQTYEWQWRQFN